MRRCAVLAILMYLSTFRLLRSVRLASYPLATLSDLSDPNRSANKKAVFRRLFCFAAAHPTKRRTVSSRSAVRAICL